jgi:serine/threonine protein kinase
MYITVMEYLDGGELFERVATDDFTLTESDCCLFLRQICRGVQYLHTRNIVHLDLKVMLIKTTLLQIAFLLKVPYGQIGFAREWYHWIGLEKDINYYRLFYFLNF